MRVPGVQYDRPVQGLALSDVSGPGRVARAEADALIKTGQAKSLQMTTVAAIEKLELEGELGFRQGELDAWKFKQQMKAYDRTMVANVLNGVAAVAQLGSNLYGMKVANEKAAAGNIYNKIMTEGTPALKSDQYRLEQEKPNSTPQVVSNSDMLVGNFNNLHRQAKAEAMAGVKTKAARGALEVSFEEDGVARRADMISTAISWKKTDNAAQFDKNMSSYLTAGDWDGASGFLKQGVGTDIIAVGSKAWSTYDNAIAAGKQFDVITGAKQAMGRAPDPGMVGQQLSNSISSGEFPGIAPQDRAKAITGVDAALVNIYGNRMDDILTTSKGGKLGELPTARAELKKFVDTPYRELGFSDAQQKSVAAARMSKAIGDRDLNTVQGYKNALTDQAIAGGRAGVAMPSRGLRVTTSTGKQVELSHDESLNAIYNDSLTQLAADEIDVQELTRRLAEQYGLPSDFVADQTDNLRSGNPDRILASVSTMKSLRYAGGGGQVAKVMDGLDKPEKALFYGLDRMTPIGRPVDEDAVARFIVKHEEMKAGQPDTFRARETALTEMKLADKAELVQQYIEQDERFEGFDADDLGSIRGGVEFLADVKINAKRLAAYSIDAENALYNGYRTTTNTYGFVTRFGELALMKNQPESYANNELELAAINDDFNSTMVEALGDSMDEEMYNATPTIIGSRMASDGVRYPIYAFTNAEHQPVINQSGPVTTDEGYSLIGATDINQEMQGQVTQWWAAPPEMKMNIKAKKEQLAVAKRLEHTAAEQDFDVIDDYLRSNGYSPSRLLSTPSDEGYSLVGYEYKSWLKERLLPARTFRSRDPGVQAPIDEGNQVYKDAVKAAQIQWEDAMEYVQETMTEQEAPESQIRAMLMRGQRAWKLMKGNIGWQKLKTLKAEVDARGEYMFEDAIDVSPPVDVQPPPVDAPSGRASYAESVPIPKQTPPRGEPKSVPAGMNPEDSAYLTADEARSVATSDAIRAGGPSEAEQVALAEAEMVEATIVTTNQQLDEIVALGVTEEAQAVSAGRAVQTREVIQKAVKKAVKEAAVLPAEVIIEPTKKQKANLYNAESYKSAHEVWGLFIDGAFGDKTSEKVQAKVQKLAFDVIFLRGFVYGGDKSKRGKRDWDGHTLTDYPADLPPGTRLN